MKKTNLFRMAMLFSVVAILNSCEKSGTGCRTCHARYGGSTIKSEEKCSAAEEEEFKTEYYYATVTCD